jgi:hypothetical protein
MLLPLGAFHAGTALIFVVVVGSQGWKLATLAYFPNAEPQVFAQMALGITLLTPAMVCGNYKGERE